MPNNMGGGQEDGHVPMTADSLSLLGKRIEPTMRTPANLAAPYFWGPEPPSKAPAATTGYTQLREIIGEGRPQDWQQVLLEGEEILKVGFKDIATPRDGPDVVVREVTLSKELQQWREDQHKAGRMLPSKGNGLVTASDEVVEIMNAHNWPRPMLLNGALFGSGMTNMLIGAHDAETLFSNYVTDLCFYYEHAYHRVFPEFEALLDEAAADPRARATLGGKERRQVMEYTLQYVRCKVALEEKHKAALPGKVMRLNWRDAMVLYLCENSIVGMAAEQVARGYDAAGVYNDFMFSCPGTDIIDVGSDLCNSELVNAVLCAADIFDTGVVTEAALRRVYDAWAHSSARMWTARWSDPGARMCSVLYTWHIMNNRHGFLRRAVLGYPKISTAPVDQREADVFEVFDADLRTTGFSRPLAAACDGADWCDHVQAHLRASPDRELLEQFWALFSVAPLEYARSQAVSAEREDDLTDRLRLAMAKAYAMGLIDDMVWLLAHANQHAWQVNRMFEAAMWGSLLDDGSLSGKLDRKE